MIPRAGFARLERADRAGSSRRSAKEGADAWFKQGAKQRFLDRPGRQPRRLGEGRRHSRCLVRFRLDPCLRAGEAARPRLAGRRSISKAPTSIAAGSSPRCWRLCGTRGRAPYDAVVTHGFVRRRGRAQDVEIARQCGGAAGRDPPVGRRDLAALGHELGLCRGPAHRPRHHQGQCRVLSQAQEHAPLPARQSRPLPGRASPCLTPRCPSSSATCSRASPSSNDAVREGYCGVRLQARLPCAAQFLRQRSLRLLFRHPQGRALLRSLRQPDAPRGADRARQAVRSRSPPGSRPCSASPWRRPGSTASPATRARCISGNSRRSRASGATRRSPRNGARCARVRRVVTGALEIERKEGRIGSSLEAAPKVYVADKELRAALSRRRSRRDRHHQRRAADAGRGA